MPCGIVGANPPPEPRPANWLSRIGSPWTICVITPRPIASSGFRIAPLGGVPATVIVVRSAVVSTAPSGISLAAATTRVVDTGFDAVIRSLTTR